MKVFLMVIATLFLGIYWYGAVKDVRNEKIWVKQYNKIYATKNPDKVAVVNDYYDCLTSSKSVIEGCDVHVAHTKADTVFINDYLNGLNQYIEKKKKD